MMSEAISQEESKDGGWNYLKAYSLISLVPMAG